MTMGQELRVNSRRGEEAGPDPLTSALTRAAGIEVPLICGPMYPCSNPELVAAVSDAGGLDVFQPVSLTYVHGHEFRAGIRLMRQLTDRPIGMNALIEASSKKYLERMHRWIDIALEEDVRFFITSLGKPQWVVERVHAAGGVVYHDATERKPATPGAAPKHCRRRGCHTCRPRTVCGLRYLLVGHRLFHDSPDG